MNTTEGVTTRYHISRDLIPILASITPRKYQGIFANLAERMAIAGRRVCTENRYVKPERRTEPAPACCIAFYGQIARAGTAEDVLKIAKISRYFRDHYPGAINWAKTQVVNPRQISS